MSSKPSSAPVQQRRAAAASDNSGCSPVAAVDEASRLAAYHRLDMLTKPQGALGRLEPLAAQVCGVFHTLHPAIEQPVALVFDRGMERVEYGANLSGQWLETWLPRRP